MVFSEPIFLFCFLVLALGVYYLLPFRFRNLWLFVTGLLFYAWGEPKYVVVMIISTLIDYCAGRFMDRFDDRPGFRRSALILSVVMNLSLLAVFKYSGFAVRSVNSVFGTAFTVPGIPLPIGISFFTFQSMSYTIDLYRRNIRVQKNFINFAAFVTMFPQIVAGPIVRYEDVSAELVSRRIDAESLSDGIRRFLCGLGKKVLLANSVGALWDAVKATDYAALPAVTAWLGILAFAFQIYFDFSGYSDMAIGLGRMLGFHFPENFRYPYLSDSVTDFWRRWHMTLGGWFRSYVYIPLGGNRHGAWRTARNLLITWFLTGLWHGASANFILWGLYYGVLLLIERFALKKVLPRIPKWLRIPVTFALVLIGWVIFEIPTVGGELSFVAALFGAGGGADAMTLYYLRNYAPLLLVCAFAALPVAKQTADRLRARAPRAFEWGSLIAELAVFLLSIAYIVDASYNPFLYFNF